MAKILKQFTIGQKGSSIYPWDAWTTGSVVRAEAKQDFKCPANSFLSALYGKARSMGMKVEVRTDSKVGAVEFQFTKRDGRRGPKPVMRRKHRKAVDLSGTTEQLI